MSRIYKFYISGSMSSRHQEYINDGLIPAYNSSTNYPFILTDPGYFTDKILDINRFASGSNETTFEIEIADYPGDLPHDEASWFETIIDTIRNDIVSHTAEYEDITPT